ncbi:hypothetical protein RN001_009998 [Aquatica leii]|uniref:Uncharacterized protein n=1 Tax=Aquatica leii TaxID=1421715 RepID=A0AAN7PVX5_9COLE|nr:hypothetical protein RN001_009998 [Aquatica leii]
MQVGSLRELMISACSSLDPGEQFHYVILQTKLGLTQPNGFYIDMQRVKFIVERGILYGYVNWLISC